MSDEDRPNLRRDIESAVNRHSAENTSNTPDFILARFLMASLAAFDTAVQQRETWYGRDARPTLGEPEVTLDPGYRPPSVADGTVDADLVEVLRKAGDEWGPAGVARVAAELAAPPERES